MKKAAIYLRTSTTHQDYERQRDEIIEYAKRNDYTITNVYEEKMSGAIDERPQFEQLCLLTKEEVDVIIVWELSRLARKLTTIVKAVEEFANKGISVITLKENFHSLDDNGQMTSQATIMLGLFASMAQIERSNIKERTTSGKRNKIIKGEMTYTAKAPFGYRLVNGMFQVVEEEAVIIRHIYDDYIEGISIRTIAKTYGIKDFNSVKRYLKNTAYYGEHYSKSVDKVLSVPAIITKETFEKAREVAKEKTITKRKNGSIKNPFKGKVYCQSCGRLFSKSNSNRWQAQCHHSVSESTLVNSTKALSYILQYKMKEYSNEDEIKAEIQRLKGLKKSTNALLKNQEVDTEDAKKKLEVLKSVYTIEQLKKEVSEIQRMEKKVMELSDELTAINKRIKEYEDAINVDIKANIHDLIEHIDVRRCEGKERKQQLVFHLTNKEEVTIEAKTHGLKAYRLISWSAFNFEPPLDLTPYVLD